MDQLSLDLKEANLSSQRELRPGEQWTLTNIILINIERDSSLEQLKVHGRDPNYADPIFTKLVCRECTSCLCQLTVHTGHRNLDPTCLR